MAADWTDPTSRFTDSQVLVDAMRRLTERHADRLRQLGPIRVLALDPCPRCMGRVIATETTARCASGCGWRYQPESPLVQRVNAYTESA